MGSTQADLARAIAFAATAHAQQIDKSGRPYILHPVRVMQRLQHLDLAVQIVAILHDVIEDTSVTLEQLAAMGFEDDVIEGVDAMSRRKGEEYFAYIERCSRSRIGSLVKLADLDDNSDPVRAFAGHETLVPRYRRAREVIQRAMGEDRPRAH